MLLTGNPRDGFGYIPSEPVKPAASRPLAGTGHLGAILTPPSAQAATFATITTANNAPVAASAQVNPTGAKPLLLSPSAQAAAIAQAVTANNAPAINQACSSEPGGCGSSNGLCSSDSRLIYLNGAWHVKSVPSDDLSCIANLPLTAKQIIQEQTAAGLPIYVGPFAVDFINNPNGQITNLTNPWQIGPLWGQWLAVQALQGMLRTLQQPYTPTQGIGGSAVNVYPTTETLPATVGATQWLGIDGQPLAGNYTPPQSANPAGTAGGGDSAAIEAAVVAALTQLTGAAPSVTTPTLPTGTVAYPGNIISELVGNGTYPPFTFPAVPAVAASGGHALYPRAATAAKDAHGYYLTSVQYDNDPNTYSYYSQAAWLDALSPVMNAIGIGLSQAILTPGLLSNFDALQLNGPLPVAKFFNPITGAQWGLWVTLPGPGQFYEGQWNTAIDAPNGAAITTGSGSGMKQWGGMQIAVAPIPKETFWDKVVADLDWIPEELGSALWTLAGFMSTFVCALAGQTSMMKSVPPVPAAQAAALAALAIANAAQCGGPPVDCSQVPADDPVPPPQCVAPVSVPIATPWWQQWWVLAAAGLGLVYFLTKKKKKPGEKIEIPAEGILGPRLPPPPVYHPRKGLPPGVPAIPGLQGHRRARERRGYAR